MLSFYIAIHRLISPPPGKMCVKFTIATWALSTFSALLPPLLRVYFFSFVFVFYLDPVTKMRKVSGQDPLLMSLSFGGVRSCYKSRWAPNGRLPRTKGLQRERNDCRCDTKVEKIDLLW